MKLLGVEQYQSKKFKYIPLTGEWKDHIGDLETNFIGMVFGKSGSGKTEYCMRMAKMFCKWYRVEWLSYEQRHNGSLLRAINRNKMQEVKSKFFALDPLAKTKSKKGEVAAPDNRTKYQKLVDYLRTTKARIIFIDSIQYLEMNLTEYFLLKEEFGDRLGIIFISHMDNNRPEGSLAKKVEYDGEFSFHIKHFIARQTGKNRCGGLADFIISEERARLFDPLYFKAKEIEE